VFLICRSRRKSRNLSSCWKPRSSTRARSRSRLTACMRAKSRPMMKIYCRRQWYDPVSLLLFYWFFFIIFFVSRPWSLFLTIRKDCCRNLRHTSPFIIVATPPLHSSLSRSPWSITTTARIRAMCTCCTMPHRRRAARRSQPRGPGGRWPGRGPRFASARHETRPNYSLRSIDDVACVILRHLTVIWKYFTCYQLDDIECFDD
jgi:hypothetical protein